MRKVATEHALSAVVALLMALQAGSGLLLQGWYRDELWIRSAWLGNDVVTLTVAVPLLAFALLRARRGSGRATLLWLGMLGYSVYNTAYYLFGAALNAFFPLYVVLFVLSIAALVLALVRLDPSALARGFGPTTPVRLVGGYLAFVGSGLAMAWIAQWWAYIAGGQVPNIGVDAFRLVAALDLSLMSTALVSGGVLLWRRRPWGYVLAAIAGVQGAAYTLVLTAGSAVASLNGVQGAGAEIPIWATLTALTTLSMGLLLGHATVCNPAQTRVQNPTRPSPAA